MCCLQKRKPDSNSRIFLCDIRSHDTWFECCACIPWKSFESTENFLNPHYKIAFISVMLSAHNIRTIKILLIFWADFFITSYETSPCDSIGGVVKHLLANPSLRSLKEPTDTPEKLFLCCKNNIKDVRFLFVSHSDVENHVSELPCMMYLNVRGARSYHRYVSTSISTFEMRRASFCHKHNPRVSSSEKK